MLTEPPGKETGMKTFPYPLSGYRVAEVEDDYGTTSVLVQFTNQPQPDADATIIMIVPIAVRGTSGMRAEVP
jgi:hypothetical protein